MVVLERGLFAIYLNLHIFCMGKKGWGMKPEQYLEELVLRYPALNSVMDRLTEAYVVMEKCFRQGGKL